MNLAGTLPLVGRATMESMRNRYLMILKCFLDDSDGSFIEGRTSMSQLFGRESPVFALRASLIKGDL